MTTAIQIKPSPKGPTQNTQNPDNGVVRYNEKLGRFETYNASWDDLSSLVGSLGPIVGFQAYTNNVRQVLPQQNSFSMWQISYSKKQANTKLVIYAKLNLFGAGGQGTANIGIGIGGVSAAHQFQGCLPITSNSGGDFKPASGVALFTGLGAGNQNIHFGWIYAGGYVNRPAPSFNPNVSDSHHFIQQQSSAIVIEAAF